MKRLPLLSTAEPQLGPLDPALQDWGDTVRRELSADQLRTQVQRFPAPRNRLHSPEAMTQADDMIAHGFAQAGWTVERQAFVLRDVPGNLDYGAYDYVIYERVEGVNILAIKAGEASDEVIVVDAHHDTVRDSPGADDNTASVVALLELAQVLAPYRFRRTIILCATDMEELSFFGARAVLSKLTTEHRITGAIVLETMAYSSSEPNTQMVPPGVSQIYPGQVQRVTLRQYRGDFTAVIYNGPAIALARSFGQGLAHCAGANAPLLLRDPNDLPVVGQLLQRTLPVVRNFSRSNHVLFREAGIPVLQITDTANFRNRNYHQPTDTWDALDYDRLAAIVGATAIAMAQAAQLVERP